MSDVKPKPLPERWPGGSMTPGRAYDNLVVARVLAADNYGTVHADGFLIAIEKKPFWADDFREWILKQANTDGYYNPIFEAFKQNRYLTALEVPESIPYSSEGYELWRHM